MNNRSYAGNFIGKKKAGSLLEMVLVNWSNKIPKVTNEVHPWLFRLPAVVL